MRLLRRLTDCVTVHNRMPFHLLGYLLLLLLLLPIFFFLITTSWTKYTSTMRKRFRFPSESKKLGIRNIPKKQKKTKQKTRCLSTDR